METEGRVWLSFDLGLSGDYQGLYSWLDDQKAVECGAGTASFIFKANSENLFEEVEKSIHENVRLDGKTRLYLIYKDENTDKFVGRFIFGNRQKEPWTGYGQKNKTALIDE